VKQLILGVISLCLSACVGAAVRSPATGKTIAIIGGDATNVRVVADGVTFTADQILYSPTARERHKTIRYLMDRAAVGGIIPSL